MQRPKISTCTLRETGGNVGVYYSVVVSYYNIIVRTNSKHLCTAAIMQLMTYQCKNVKLTIREVAS